jgi:site-specific recombinase XerD
VARSKDLTIIEQEVAEAASYAPAPLTRATTDEGLVRTWLAQHSASPHTRRIYERTARRFLAALPSQLRSATLEDMRKGFEAIAVREDGSPAARSTVTAQTAIVKSLLSFGARVGYLRANLGELFKLKAVPPDRARRIMSEADTFVLLRSAETERDSLLLETAYYGGLRVSELVSLTWGRLLDREDGKLQIAGLVGKGGKEREVLLPADLAARLRAFRQGGGHDEPVFKARASTQRTATDRPAQAMSARAVLKVIKRIATRAPLPDRVQGMVSPHWLRHAHASHALDNGAPISLVQQTLGHGSIKTTSIYAHAKPGDSSALYLKKVR